MWEKAISQRKAASGLKNIKKPTKKRPGKKKARSIGGLSSMVTGMKTSLGAQNPTPLAGLQPESCPGPVTTDWEKRRFSERASAASLGTGIARKTTATIIYFSLSKEKGKRSCEVASEHLHIQLFWQHSGISYVKGALGYDCLICQPYLALLSGSHGELCPGHGCLLDRKVNLGFSSSHNFSWGRKTVFLRKSFFYMLWKRLQALQI